MAIKSDRWIRRMALEHGMIDMVVPRTDMRNTLARLFKLYTMRDASATPIPADV